MANGEFKEPPIANPEGGSPGAGGGGFTPIIGPDGTIIGFRQDNSGGGAGGGAGGGGFNVSGPGSVTVDAAGNIVPVAGTGASGGGSLSPLLINALKDAGIGLGTSVATSKLLEILFPFKKPNAGEARGIEDFPLAQQTLLDILMNRGRTDPQMFNRQLVGIARGTEGQQQDFQGRLAQQGLQNSGVGLAIQGAIGAAGQDRLAAARAQENALAEQRMRSDLGLILDLIINPDLTEQATRAGVSQSIAQANAARQAGFAQAGAGVLDSILNSRRQ